jgi:hypothetical protein
VSSSSDQFGELKCELVRRFHTKFLAGDRWKSEFTVDPPAELCSSLFAVVAAQG